MRYPKRYRRLRRHLMHVKPRPSHHHRQSALQMRLDLRPSPISTRVWTLAAWTAMTVWTNRSRMVRRYLTSMPRRTLGCGTTRGMKKKTRISTRRESILDGSRPSWSPRRPTPRAAAPVRVKMRGVIPVVHSLGVAAGLCLARVLRPSRQYPSARTVRSAPRRTRKTYSS